MGFNTYLTIHDYLRQDTGQEKTSLYGNLFRLGGTGVAAGANSLPVVPNTTTNLAVNDIITIFDGALSEEVLVTATTNAGANAIPVAATQYAHAATTSGCSDGRLGSLARAIEDGSAEVERICRQPLLQATYTSETLPLKSTRAWIDNNSRLGIRPLQFPVTAVAAINIQYSPSNVINVDASQVVIPARGRLVEVPIVKVTGSGGQFQQTNWLDPRSDGQVLITYTAGYVYSALPRDVSHWCTLLVSNILSDRANPTGAADYKVGGMQTSAFLRGDLTGEGALIKRAKKGLKLYTQDAW